MATKLTPAQIYALARGAGFDAREAEVMTAIAMRESAGNPMAHNPDRSTGDNSYGLWQINMIDSLGPQRRKGYGLTRNEDLFDPATNARAAYLLYKSRQASRAKNPFDPWSTDPNHMTSGRVPIRQEYIDAAHQAALQYRGDGGWTPGLGGDIGGHSTAPTVPGLGADYVPDSSGAVDTPGGAAIDLPANLQHASDQQIKDWLKVHYGYAAGWVDAPEVGPILLRAAREGWDALKLQGEISGTSWWKSTSDSARQWMNLTVTDPASAEQQRSQRLAELGVEAQTMGLALTPERLKLLSEDSLKYAWSSQQLRSALVAESSYSPAQAAQGQLGSNTATVKALAASYFVPMSGQSAFQYGQAITAGTLTTDGLAAQLASLAKGRFPTLAKVIDSGVTPSAYFSPYKETIAQLLEVAPDSIDLLNDPRWSAVIDTVPQGGTMADRRPMTLSETQAYARGLPEWDKTQNARTAAGNMAQFISGKFGRTAA